VERVRVLVVGAGFSGLCAAVKLRQAGIEDFVVLDRASEVGGTWRDNTYPGCACDVPSALYSFSFEPKPDWSRFFASQPEIRAYGRTVAERHGVVPHLRFDADVIEGTWDDDAQRWTVKTTAGDYEAQVLIAGTGPWHEPVYPDIPGRERFEGASFHSSRWDHDHDLGGSRVAVIGSGASAVQFVPKIQPEVDQLHLFQRTPHWVLPKPDRPLTAVEHTLFERFPVTQRALRGGIYYGSELLGRGMLRPPVMARLQRIAERHLERQVPDPVLRARLTPDYTLGCKRLLLSNDYYPALTRPNVDVVPEAVTEIRERSVVGSDGIEREVDTIVYGTGFRLLDMPIAEWLRGSDGRLLADVWQGSPRGYMGTTVAGFPNAFMLLGPNLGNGHSSATVLIELQVDYVIDALRAMDRGGIGSVVVRADVQDEFNARVDERLASSIWNAGGCASYYLDRNGRNSFMYPWSTIHLRRRLRRFDVERFHTRPLTAPAANAAAA
jgi:cation diffusion facilitator CzcD-associated flavoprotein CzcO